MSDSSAKVSIVIPVYNGADYLEEAIQSALAQTYSNIELIVVNDGSKDDGASERIALSHGKRLRYFSKANGGVASALNLAVSQMTGDYFSWLSHDDLYCPEKVEREVEFISRLPETERGKAIVYSDFSVFSDNPEEAEPVLMEEVPHESFRRWLTEKSMLHGCTLLVPRSAFDACGYFDESLRTTQDYDLWFRMAANHCFYRVPLVLVMARSHAGQGSSRMASTVQAEGSAMLLRFVSSLRPDELGRSAQYSVAVAYAEIAASMWYRGFNRAAAATARLALRHSSSRNGRNFLIVARNLAWGILQYYLLKVVRFMLTPRMRLVFSRLLRRLRSNK